MKHSKFLKGATLLGFVMMLSAFVAYRSGAFNNNSVALLNNGDYISKMPVDSPPVKQTIMPSSKFGPIFEKPQSSGTSTVVATGTYVPQDVMPSSKSAGVFHGDDVHTATISPPPNNRNNSNRNPAPANQNNKPK